MIIGVGVDVIEISRVRALVEGKGGRAVARLFTETERRYAEGMANPARHFAARVAAKEAAFKALAGSEAARGIGWREMEVVLDDAGRPGLAFHGRAQERAHELGVTRAWISLSHADDLATAFVVLESVPGATPSR
jgi:holo-[acyl-carrier protein] synthase